MKIQNIVVFDIDGVIRDVSLSYRRAIADTVEYFSAGEYRPIMSDIDELKGEGVWNNDWKASEELVYRYFEAQGQKRTDIHLDYQELVDFFQARYRGENPLHWDGYITTEPLLLSSEYLEQLSSNGIKWGFFSGATRGSVEYVLTRRLGLKEPVVVAMEDAPSKPDPTGLLETVRLLEENEDNKTTPVIYVGDTVADIYTVVRARELQPQRVWIGVGVLPPHVQSNEETAIAYGEKLKQAGATVVLEQVTQLTASMILDRF